MTPTVVYFHVGARRYHHLRHDQNAQTGSVHHKTKIARIFVASAIAMASFFAAHAQTPSRSEPSLPYTVQASDTLSRFSRQVLVSPRAWQEVAAFNQLKDGNVLSIGQRLNIPLRLLKSSPAGGKVISAEGDVTQGGNKMVAGEPLASGSQFKTGANSSAVIELGDGSRIKLLPNSLAEIVSSKNYALRDASSSGSTNWFSGVMRLSEGALEALASKTTKRATPLQIETPTSVVGVRGTEFRVAFDDPASKGARTEVIEGKVRADNPAQKSGADLPMGTGAVVKPLEKEVRVVILLPAPDLSAISADVLKPQGTWPMPNLAGASGYHVQVASDEQFDKIVRDVKVASSAGASADLSSLANGNWFARVRGIDGVGLEGYNTVKLIAVKDGEWRVTYSSLSNAGGSTLLSWVGQQAGGQPLTADSYSAVVASDAALTQAARSVPSATQISGKSPSLNLGDLKPGVYYVQLTSKEGLRSAIYRFELSANWGVTQFDQTSALQALSNSK